MTELKLRQVLIRVEDYYLKRHALNKVKVTSESLHRKMRLNGFKADI